MSDTSGTLYTYYIAINLKNRGFSCDFTPYNILLALSCTILRYTVFQKYTWQRTARFYCTIKTISLLARRTLKCVQSVPSVPSILANHRACNKNCGFHSTGRFGRFGRFWNLKKWVTLKSILSLLFSKASPGRLSVLRTLLKKGVCFFQKCPQDAFFKTVSFWL